MAIAFCPLIELEKIGIREFRARIDLFTENIVLACYFSPVTSQLLSNEMTLFITIEVTTCLHY